MAYIPQEKLAFSCHLADHCNLRCKGCDNYAPAAPACFADLAVFRRDLTRIRTLFGTRVSSIQLLGGEPLLNPQIEDFLVTARSIFPERDCTEVSIVTNGLLLPRMSDRFWQTCRDQGIVVRYTRYPIPADYEAAAARGAAFSVPVERYGRPGEEGKTLQFDPFDLEGRQDIEWNFRHCFHANKCIQVREGRIYTCNIRAFADLFCRAFGVDLPLSDADSLDLQADLTAEQIMTFLSRPIPFCRFCDIRHRDDGHLWRRCPGPAEIHDWLLFRPDARGAAALNRYRQVIFLSGTGETGDTGDLARRCEEAGLDPQVRRLVLPLPQDPDELPRRLRRAGAAPEDALVIRCADAPLRLRLERAAVEGGYPHCYLLAQEE